MRMNETRVSFLAAKCQHCIHSLNRNQNLSDMGTILALEVRAQFPVTE